MAYDLPSWLQADAPSEPFKALLAGAQVGNEIARTVNSARSQAGALAQRAYEFEKVQQVQEGIRQYQMQEAELHLEKMKLAKDYQFQTDRAQIKIGNLLTTKKPTDPTFMEDLGAILADHPAAWDSPAAKHALGLPGEVAKINLQTAQARHYSQPDILQPTAEMRNIEAQVRRADQTHFLETGEHLSPLAISQLGTRLGAPKNFSMKLDNQGNLQMAYGPEGENTIATESLAQKRILNAREYTSQIDDTLAGMTGDAVGFKGKINEWKNRTLGQINPEWVNLPVAEQRVRIANLNETHLAQYERLGRMSQLDRERVREIGPTEGWFDTPERGIRALDTMRSIAKKNAIIDAKSAKMPIEDWMIQGLKPKDLTDLNQRGALTKDEAIAAYRKLFPAAQ